MEHPWKKEGPSSPAAINRAYKPRITVAVRTTEALAEAVDTRAVAGGAVEIPAANATSSLTFYATTSNDPDVTFLPLYDVNGDAVVRAIAAAGGVYPLPDEIYNVPYFKMISDANENVYVSMKG